MLKFSSIFVLGAILAGCATSGPPMSREEYLATTQRVYEGKTPDETLNAAEQLFRLADGDDFTFHHNDDALLAHRNWSIYIVLAATFGSDQWLIKAQEVDGGTKVSAQVGTSSGNIIPAPTTGGDMAAFGTPGGGSPVRGTAIYDLFWARMDYLLGKTDHWMTCAEADQRVKDGIVWGKNEALCNSFNMKDLPPPAMHK